MNFVLRPRGPFSLAAAGAFAAGFPGTIAAADGEQLRFAWTVDDDWRVATVSLRQTAQTVRGELGDGAPRGARDDVERILCLDVDGTGFGAVGKRDPVVGRLQARYPGLRPVLFYTPYETATWAIIGNRIRISQAEVVRQRLADDLGEGGAFPGPDRIVDLRLDQPGLTDVKVQRLRALAAAALDGVLSRAALREAGAEEALERLQRLPGIGPFSAELTWVRGVGDPDWLPAHETRLVEAVTHAYGLSGHTDLEAIAEPWRPYRAWVSLLLRRALQDA